MASDSRRKVRAHPVLPTVWAPAVQLLLGEGPVVDLIKRLQEGQTGAEIRVALTLSEGEYWELLGLVHDAAVVVVKAYRNFVRLRAGEIDLGRLREEDRLDAEVIRLFAAEPSFIDMLERVPLSARRVIEVLNALTSTAGSRPDRH